MKTFKDLNKKEVDIIISMFKKEKNNSAKNLSEKLNISEFSINKVINNYLKSIQV